MNTQKSHEEEKVVEKFIEYYNSFQVDEMGELFTDDCLFQNISNTSRSVECRGKEDFLKLATQSALLFKERKQTITNWSIGDHKIAVELDYQAILAHDMPNGLKRGETLELKGISIYEFESGKIKRLIDFS
jgi:steroid delta-isomerase-like uncharacterized protein